MGLFSNTTKIIKSEDYANLANRISDLGSEIKVIKNELEALRTNQNSLRGFVNRKINPEVQEEKKEDLKGGLPFPFGGA